MKALTLHAHEVRRLQATGGVTLWRPVKPQFTQLWGQGIRHGTSCYSIHVDIKEPDGTWRWLRCPHGAPGESRWCRETWRPSPEDVAAGIEYQADNLLRWFDGTDAHVEAQARRFSRDGRWRSPVTMPRWASRYTVAVQDVTCKQIDKLTRKDISQAGFNDPIPEYDHVHFKGEWFRRYARTHPADLWWLWAWGVTLTLAKED